MTTSRMPVINAAEWSVVYAALATYVLGTNPTEAGAREIARDLLGRMNQQLAVLDDGETD